MKTTRKRRKVDIPIIDINRDVLVSTLSLGTKLGKRDARRAIQVVENNIIKAAKENDEIEVEELGLFRNESPRGVIPELIFKPLQPEEIEFPEMEVSEK